MVKHDDIKFCVDEAMNLERSPMVVPPRFHDVLFNFDRYPGALGVQGLEGGANCQLYAYEFLREHGFSIGELRSSNLWEDTEYTFEVPNRSLSTWLWCTTSRKLGGPMSLSVSGIIFFSIFHDALASRRSNLWKRSWRAPTTSI